MKENIFPTKDEFIKLAKKSLPIPRHQSVFLRPLGQTGTASFLRAWKGVSAGAVTASWEWSLCLPLKAKRPT